MNRLPSQRLRDNYLRGLLYNKEVAALQKSLSSCPTSVPWDVEIRPCTSGSSNECQQRVRRSTELQFPPSITSISKSLFANSSALAKSFSSVVFLVRLSRQFGLTGRKAARRSKISSRFLSAGVKFCHVNVFNHQNTWFACIILVYVLSDDSMILRKCTPG